MFLAIKNDVKGQSLAAAVKSDLTYVGVSRCHLAVITDDILHRDAEGVEVKYRIANNR